MADAHDVAVFRAGGHFKVAAQRTFVDDERMVARERAAFPDDAEQPAPVKVHFFHDAVADVFRLHDGRAECLRDRLMPQADAQNRHFSRKMPDGFY